MVDSAREGQAIAAAIEDQGTTPAWFEEFGRDADAGEGYRSEVDSSTIYLAIMNEILNDSDAVRGEENRPVHAWQADSRRSRSSNSSSTAWLKSRMARTSA